MKRSSDPKVLAARLERARSTGEPMDLDYEDCTGVIDLALGKARESRDEAISKARALVRNLGHSKVST